MHRKDLIDWIEKEQLGNAKADEPMADYTSWHIGGPASVMVWPKDTDACRRILQHCKEAGIPVAILGFGTNLLVADDGIDALVINTREMNWIDWNDTKVRAGAGVSLANLAGQAARKGLQGLAFAAGIPGSLGGAVLMNAGAYNGMMSDVVSRVTVLDEDGRLQVLDKEDIHYGYRISDIKKYGWFVAEAVLSLQPGDREAIEKEMNEYLKARKEKQPLELPNGGSVFKNPTGAGAGRFIDRAGLKGLRIGDAQVSLKHANFIVNLGHATAKDTYSLIRTVQQRILQEFGVSLEPEVIFWGLE
jgi:UDP-N-acetylmuramate dehydrogenase